MTWETGLDVEPEACASQGCVVCRRGDGRGKPAPLVTLPSGRSCRLCQECQDDRFRVEEAERRTHAGDR